MNDIIKIFDKEEQQEVSARDLHKFLECTERFSNWIERHFQYGFIENVDYAGCKEINTLANQDIIDYGFEDNIDFTSILGKRTGRRPSVDYVLTLDCATHIAMYNGLKKESK